MENIQTPHDARAAIAVGLTARGIEPALTTDEAAVALGLKPQTLHKWACLENGPIRPVRVGRRLAWSAADVRALLAGGTK
ncbi:DNA-binding protein [Paraburkholderia guartelaensis]|uniref:DNA-binding protein n=1 Tax=Paraburkholderia guartelaensis TaxID=2546446 RepID=A0A4R5L0V2_9BURK|nr:helix-turn-helix domain-containing protein [Paraburkholderia guartelaensis]TDG02094.1 DNA-binding protein [Paraburkholderia guartelaensis]